MIKPKVFFGIKEEQALENKSISLHSKIISTFETLDKNGERVKENTQVLQEGSCCQISCPKSQY